MHDVFPKQNQPPLIAGGGTTCRDGGVFAELHHIVYVSQKSFLKK
jgi:hypothetical protein